MALDIRTVVSARRAVQYDGTNGAEITAIFGVTPDSDDGQTLVWTVSGDSMQAELGSWVTWSVTSSGPLPGGDGSPDALFRANVLFTSL